MSQEETNNLLSTFYMPDAGPNTNSSVKLVLPNVMDAQHSAAERVNYFI